MTGEKSCRRIAIAGIVASVILTWVGPHSVSAQTFPSHPITVIIPFPAGGPTDSIGRILAERMRASLRTPVIIENVTGAAGSIGVGRVARAKPDGYTLSLGTWSTHVVNGATLSLQYDVLDDFSPIAMISDSPMLVVSRKTIPANDLKEFISWLKSNPGASLGVPGIGGAGHLAGTFFRNRTNTRLQVVPYRGVGPAMQDMIAGRIDLMFDLVANSLAHLRAGSIKAYAVLAGSRFETVPDVPTVDEAGQRELYVSSWQAMWAPKGTPPDAIAKINAAIVESLSDAGVRQRLTSMAQKIPPREQQTPEALGELQRTEIKKWWPIIKAAGIRGE